MKITKNINEATLITHSGVFHADEVLSACILWTRFPEKKLARVNRVPAQVTNDTIVFDIGGGTFDHHQIGGNGVRKNGIPYSSAGLIWKKFGYYLVANTTDPDFVWASVDRMLVQGIDAVDNGCMPNADYPAQAMSISSIIAGFNPVWDEPGNSDTAFMRAVEFMNTVLANAIANAASRARAKTIVEKAVSEAENHIMVLNQYVPYQEFIRATAGEKAADIWFCVYPSNREGYNWACIPNDANRFTQRHPVPVSWRGLHDEELQAETGIHTAIFCHKEGFIGAAGTLEDAIAMVRLAA